MRKGSFRWRLYASYAGLVLLTGVLTGFFVDRQVEESLVQELEASLRDKTVLVSPFAERAFAQDPPPGLARETGELARESGTRLTLILPDGRVLADSDEDPAAMDNHAARPEVREALEAPFGSSRRHSRTVGESMLYAARAIRRDGELVGIVRLALPLDEVEARLSSLRATVLAVTGGGILAALLVGAVMARRLAAPIAEMTRVAEAMRAGDYGQRYRPRSADEIGVLADVLNQLGADLAGRIATISQDESQLRAILAGMVEGVVAVDEEDRVLFCNAAASEVLGFPTEGAVGRRLWELARSSELADAVERARREGLPVRQEMALARQGKETVVNAHVAPFARHDAREGPARKGLVVVLHDVTDLRRLERIRRDFVANVSHELKTPLTSIKGYVETLLGGALADEKNNVRFLRKIETHVARLVELVQDLLSLARIESQEGRIPRVPISWRPIAEEAVARREETVRRKGLALAIEAPEGAPDVLGDREGMVQILDNLLDNAIKYTPDGGRIAIRIGQEGGRGILRVADTGSGIPASDLDRIFERFYRVDKARSRELGGTGLGLSIVKHLVQSMGGDVTVESELGAGSCFTVLLPLAQRPPN